MCRLTIDGSGVTWKLVTIARQPRPDTATSCSICNFIIWFHDRAASWCQSIITRDSHPDKFAVCPTAPIHTISTQYLYTISTQYLHNIYTASTTVSSHPARWPWPACCLSWWWRAGGRAAPAPATTSPHPASPLSCSLLSLLLRLHWVCLSLGPAALLSPEMTAPIRGQTLDSRHGNLNLADPGPGLQLQAWEWLVLL